MGIIGMAPERSMTARSDASERGFGLWAIVVASKAYLCELPWTLGVMDGDFFSCFSSLPATPAGIASPNCQLRGTAFALGSSHPRAMVASVLPMCRGSSSMVLGWKVIAVLSFVLPLASPVPENVTIGTLFAFRTRIGRAARAAIELAVDRDDAVLNGTRLLVQFSDGNCNAVQGAAAAVELIKRHKVVTIAGPQTSEVANFVAHMGRVTRVPVVSFSATDPTLSEAQYPFFLCLALSDRIQMEAIAGFVKLFEWKEVAAFYSDDSFGTSGVMELHDELGKSGCRVFVVHADTGVGRTLLIQAYNLRMLMPGYVWIVTEALASVLDTIYDDDEFVAASQGAVGTRSYVPRSPQLDKFYERWRSANPATSVNVYGLYAYDTIWTIAYAMDRLLSSTNASRSFEFRRRHGDSDLASLPVLKSGARILKELAKTSFDGASGRVELTSRGERKGSDLEIVNMNGKGVRVVGYWNRARSFNVDPSSDSQELEWFSQMERCLNRIVWPGGSLNVPRGLMIPKSGRELVIGVPLKQGYKEFVDSIAESGSVSSFHGFCIDVFKAALYTFVGFGVGNSTPSYDELVEKVANKKYDAAVGDITITTITHKRAKIVDFTQPYTTSGLVLVVPVTEFRPHHAWAFLQPFSTALWCTTLAFFLFTGAVVWVLEHDKNRDFGGRPKKQAVTTFWFTFSTLFFAQRESVKSILGRIVVIIWLFVVLILTSSYTASLTSILTVRKLRPSIQGLSRLVGSKVRIGYQQGSFVKDYLFQLNVDNDRLVPLPSISTYSSALAAKEVGAVVDELPYMQPLLSSDCKFALSGEEKFSESGWGFAFPKGSTLAADVSTAILTLAETGELQRLHETWLHTIQCSGEAVKVKSDEINVYAFSGMFGLVAVVAAVGALVHAARSSWQNYNLALLAATPLQWPSRFAKGSRFIHSWSSYVWQTGRLSSIAMTEGEGQHE
ncbi:glutamate receptor 3.2-like [Selaginella moellendorffii]|uniref:glutamate receptor 3.2-like n=1 Tax=Selaginella moellendorffii TaxID=88036 RepID=UPI000D1CA054|nr:glutamate receptor 3.2-like [Selaginella moellendorffii]|eukprot:XP_024522343.1 glutamate receptor 3.2-like [Selaginella moellendorffii]